MWTDFAILAAAVGATSEPLMHPSGAWVHNLSPFLWEFSPGVGIRYYGLAYVLGFFLSWWLLGQMHRLGRSPLGPDQRDTALFITILGVMLGGRIGYVLLYRPEMLANPLSVVAVWEGGMAAHGAMVGCVVAWAIAARVIRVPFLRLCDLFAVVAAPGLFFGRLANFVNGELWGKPTEVAWGVVFPGELLDRPLGTTLADLPARHPSQLYQAGLEGIVLGTYLGLRFWLAGRRLPAGQLAGEFLIAYAVLRSIGEVFREPDVGVELILGLSRGTFYSVVALVVGVVVVGVVKVAAARAPAKPD